MANDRRSPGMLTDRYELTMLSALVADGLAGRRAVFETFARHLPAGRRYGVVAGLGRLLPLIQAFRFSPGELGWLREQGAVTDECADYLRDFAFRGDIDAYAEGEVYLPDSPVLTVRGELGEALVLETLVLSVLNHDSAVASAASRMVVAAGGRPLIEMGARRTHEEAAVAAARAAYAMGFATTSLLAAGRTYGVPTAGTAAHAFTLAHADERAAFAAQVAAHGVGTTLLVDTFDTEQGIRNAVAVAGPGLGAIRLDSGDPAVEAARARALLDSLGATATRIVVTGDLDEHALARLATAPIDAYGVGTQLVTGSGHPTAGFVYKLVAVASGDGPDAPLHPVAKTSAAKETRGGQKRAWRGLDGSGVAREEVLRVTDDDAPPAGPDGWRWRPLQVPIVGAGKFGEPATLLEVREHHRAALGELPGEDLLVEAGLPSITVRMT